MDFDSNATFAAVGGAAFPSYSAGMLKAHLAGLTAFQIAVVTAIFFFTLIGAIIAVQAFRWWNAQSACKRSGRGG